MAYSNNPNLPRVRMQAVKLVRSGWSTVKVARHFGYAQGTIVKWCQRAPRLSKQTIPTRSSRPRHHPNELDPEIVARIIKIRKERDQCAEVIHDRLLKEGLRVSLSSVKRTLKRNHLTKYSQWKKWHQYPEKPLPERPGVLIQLDSMIDGLPQEGLRAYALIDVASRWAHAAPAVRANTHQSNLFVLRAQAQAPFVFETLQTDHGSEFSKWFSKQLISRGLGHCHSRVRTPTDNAFVERFIQTLQQQCLDRIPRELRYWRKEIPEFLQWYNHERPHMALGMKTPVEVLKLFQAID